MLGADNLAAVLGKGHPTLVEFMVPWCGHCKRLKPDYERLAERYAGTVVVAAVDCVAHPDVAEAYKIAGWPTLKLYRYGREISTYQGAHTYEGLSKYINKLIGPPLQVSPLSVWLSG